MASAPDPSREIFFERPLDSPPKELEALSPTTRWDNVPSPEGPKHGRAPQTQRQHKMPTICLRGLHFIRRLVFVIGVLVGSVVALGLMGVMGLLLLPALLLGALVEGGAKVLIWIGVDEKRVHYAIWGGASPHEIPERCNRQAAQLSEMLRGEGPLANWWYGVKNSHPVLALFLGEAGHPFSPFERSGRLVLLLTLSYFAVVRHSMLFSDEWFHWRTDVFGFSVKAGHLAFSAVCLSLPNFVFSRILEQLALADYNSNLQKTKYFEQMAEARCRNFIFRVMSPSIEREEEDAKVDTAEVDCACVPKEWYYLVDYAYERIAVLFGYNCWFVAGVLTYYAAQYDKDDSVLGKEIAQLVFSSFVTYFPLDITLFLIFWQLEHSFGFYDPGFSGSVFLGLPVVGPMEAEAELLQAFEMLDLDKGGSLSREELGEFCTAVFPELDKDVLVSMIFELDTGRDGSVSVSEFLALLPEYCEKMCWYHPSGAPKHESAVSCRPCGCELEVCTPLLARAENIESIPAVTVTYPATTPTVVHVTTLPAGETSMKPS
jgi:hypothetical protein